MTTLYDMTGYTCRLLVYERHRYICLTDFLLLLQLILFLDWPPILTRTDWSNSFPLACKTFFLLGSGLADGLLCAYLIYLLQILCSGDRKSVV